MKVLLTKVGISKKGNPYAQGLVYSERAEKFCSVSDGKGGFSDAFVPLTDEKYEEIKDVWKAGLVIEMNRRVDVE